jgi:hypothetical protein
MPAWGWIGVGYGVGMAVIAASGYARKPFTAIVASILYALAAASFASIEDVRAQVILPAAMTLAGYWLSGLFIGAPQPRLERWLLETDRRLFDAMQIDELLEAAPRWVLEAIEFVYSTVYVMVMLGAIIMAPLGRDAVLSYWALVVPAELICCAALPFLRCRPPRSLEASGVIATRNPAMRRLNDLIVSRGSIQVNTMPSAHVAAALAAGLAVASWEPAAGAALIACALLIAVAATLGRYHYAVDCALGAVVAVLLWLVWPTEVGLYY